MKTFLGFIALLFISLQSNAQINKLEEKITNLRNDTPWKLIKSVPLQFPSFHPQGMVKINDLFFMTAVEVLKSPKNGDTGEGVGNLQLSKEKCIYSEILLRMFWVEN